MKKTGPAIAVEGNKVKQKWSKPEFIVLSVKEGTLGPNKSGSDANSKKS